MWSVWHQFSFAHWYKASNWIGVQIGLHEFDSRISHKPVVSKTSEADIWLSSYDHLTDVCRRKSSGCQQLSQCKGACFLLNKKEASSGIDPSEWWWREERRTSRESLWLPAIVNWRYPIRAYRCSGAISVMFPICKASRPHSSISEEFLHSTFSGLRRILGSWNLCQPCQPSSQDEISVDGWMCCQITTPGRSV